MSEEGEVRISFGDGNPNCFHCQCGDAINALVAYHQANGEKVSFLMVLGSLVQLAASMIEQAPEEDRAMLATAAAAKIIALAEEMPNKESMN